MNFHGHNAIKNVYIPINSGKNWEVTLVNSLKVISCDKQAVTSYNIQWTYRECITILTKM